MHVDIFKQGFPKNENWGVLRESKIIFSYSRLRKLVNNYIKPKIQMKTCPKIQLQDSLTHIIHTNA